METGASGANGALVQRVANKESNHEHVNVIRQLPNTVERNAKARQRKHKSVIRMFPVQVS